MTHTKLIFKLTLQTVAFGICGLILGKIVNKFCTNLYKQHLKYKFEISLLQIAILGLIMSLVYVFLSQTIAKDFQLTLPGLAFPAFYFGTQQNIFDIWKTNVFNEYI